MANDEIKHKQKLYMREWRKKHPDVGSAYMKKYRDENPYYRIATWNKWAEKQREYKAELRELVNNYKSKPCMDCGQTYSPWIMDLDHRDRTTKVASVARLISDGSQKQIILDELEKCDVICANCHRQRTYLTIWKRD